MRLSCNGCRVLRKGCRQDCNIRPCLQWIKTPEAQANATVFLAKFYGRAGLLNLINAVPDHLRAAVFRSLLYEACGRILNPVYGSVGLLWTGSWQLCQAAVEAVLRGEPVAQIPSDSAAAATPVLLPLKSCDIRHVSKDELHKVTKSRTRFKRSAPRPEARFEPELARLCELSCTQPALSHESASHADGGEEESMFSAETGEASHVSQAEPDTCANEGEVGLELTLGMEPASQSSGRSSATRCEVDGLASDSCRLELNLGIHFELS